MSKPKKIILCPNPYRDKDMTVAARSKEILDQEGFETVVCLPFQKEGYGAELGVPIQQLDREIKRADLLIAFGGDGTILHLAKTLAMNRVPVLGINLGSLGFMSELEPDELERLRDLKNWDLSIENRMMLDVSVVRDGRTVYNTIALNDAVISKGSIARVQRRRGDRLAARRRGIDRSGAHRGAPPRPEGRGAPRGADPRLNGLLRV